jgi:alpha-tubulin suppressor-like RCC1 family protein
VTKADGTTLTRVTAVSAGLDHSCAVTSNGLAWCWGPNWTGQLGDGTTTDRPGAVRVERSGGGSLTGVTAVSAGASFSCARTGDGTAWCWGSNINGRLGSGTTWERQPERLRAVRVRKAGGGALAGVTAISAGFAHSCARTSGSAAWCWGSNGSGEVGDGTRIERFRAVRVERSGGGSLARVATVSAGESHSCARTGDGAAWCWGSNASGQLGNGARGIPRPRAVRVVKAGGGPLARVAAVSAGGWHTCAVTSDGTAWCWGSNASGQLGDRTTTRRLRATRVSASWAKTQ